MLKKTFLATAGVSALLTALLAYAFEFSAAPGRFQLQKAGEEVGAIARASPEKSYSDAFQVLADERESGYYCGCEGDYQRRCFLTRSNETAMLVPAVLITANGQSSTDSRLIVGTGFCARGH